LRLWAHLEDHSLFFKLYKNKSTARDGDASEEIMEKVSGLACYLGCARDSRGISSPEVPDPTQIQIFLFTDLIPEIQSDDLLLNSDAIHDPVLDMVLDTDLNTDQI
jgi:hypothetical protein